jgi:hypothetical protein
MAFVAVLTRSMTVLQESFQLFVKVKLNMIIIRFQTDPLTKISLT